MFAGEIMHPYRHYRIDKVYKAVPVQSCALAGCVAQMFLSAHYTWEVPVKEALGRIRSKQKSTITVYLPVAALVFVGWQQACMVVASQKEDTQHLHRVPSNSQHGSYSETRAIRISVSGKCHQKYEVFDSLSNIKVTDFHPNFTQLLDYQKDGLQTCDRKLFFRILMKCG